MPTCCLINFSIILSSIFMIWSGNFSPIQFTTSTVSRFAYKFPFYWNNSFYYNLIYQVSDHVKSCFSYCLYNFCHYVSWSSNLFFSSTYWLTLWPCFLSNKCGAMLTVSAWDKFFLPMQTLYLKVYHDNHSKHFLIFFTDCWYTIIIS